METVFDALKALKKPRRTRLQPVLKSAVTMLLPNSGS